MKELKVQKPMTTMIKKNKKQIERIKLKKITYKNNNLFLTLLTFLLYLMDSYLKHDKINYKRIIKNIL